MPKYTWEDKEKFEEVKEKLINLFRDNFKQFEANVNPEIVDAGPNTSVTV